MLHKKSFMRFASLVVVSAPALTLVNACAEATPTAFAGIRGQGSASAFPVFAILKDEIENSMQYLGNGSGEGVRVATKNLPNLDFGVASSVKLPQTDAEILTWRENKYRTVTFALDAIALVINWPSGLVTTNDARPELSLVELSKIYDTSAESTTTWGKLITNLDLARSNNEFVNKTPVAIGREHGKSASGAADAFWEVLNKNMANGSVADFNHENLIATGGGTSAEANSAALSVVDNITGSISYISLGYALKNENAKIRIPAIRNAKNQLWEPSVANAETRKYAWVRPFNIYFSTNNAKAKAFVDFLLDPNKGQKFMKFLDYVALTEAQVKAQIDGSAPYLKISEPDPSSLEGYTAVVPKVVA